MMIKRSTRSSATKRAVIARPNHKKPRTAILTKTNNLQKAVTVTKKQPTSVKKHVKPTAKKQTTSAVSASTTIRSSKRSCDRKQVLPNKLDAVFGRGRKKNHVRNGKLTISSSCHCKVFLTLSNTFYFLLAPLLGSLYRCLIEKYWRTYANMDNHNFIARKEFVQAKIIDVLLEKGGRFIMRDGDDMALLDPDFPKDLKLIYKKIQRALFNEKKRQEERGGNLNPTVFDSDFAAFDQPETVTEEEEEDLSELELTSEDTTMEEEEEEEEETNDDDSESGMVSLRSCSLLCLMPPLQHLTNNLPPSLYYFIAVRM